MRLREFVLRAIPAGALLAGCGSPSSHERGSRRGDTVTTVLTQQPVIDVATLPSVSYSIDAMDIATVGCLAALPDGRVAVLDGGGPRLLVVTPGDSGATLVTLGREGAGPGEYNRRTGFNCLASSPSGIITLLDAGNARILRWTASGRLLSQFPLSSHPGGAAPRLVPTDTSAFVHVTIRPPRPTYRRHFDPQSWAFVEVDSAGATGDTVRADISWGAEASDQSFAPVQYGLPLQAGVRLYSSSQRSAVLLVSRDGTLHLIEFPWPEISVHPDEAKELEAVMTYHSPPGSPEPPFTGIATSKAHFSEVTIAADGSIWFRRAQVSERVSPYQALPWATNPPSPVSEHREPMVYEGLDRNGRSLGAVKLPDGTQSVSFSSDHLWAVHESPTGEIGLTRWTLEGPGFD